MHREQTMARENTLRGLCLELSSERDAMMVAQRIANILAEGRQAPRVITVTDEHGNVVGKVSVPQKH
jgi:hypothetical protein